MRIDDAIERRLRPELKDDGFGTPTPYSATFALVLAMVMMIVVTVGGIALGVFLR